MCGIGGGWATEALDEGALKAALDAIVHRGPDDSGVHYDGSAFLGMRRLSIIDVGGGHQPIFNEDGTVAVVFNGEIYNYKELIPELEGAGHVFKTRSDTEVLVHLWEEHGPAMCRLLRGMFAFAIWDRRQRCLFVARDRFGKKPLYFCRTRTGGLLFASELKALRPLARGTGQARWSIRPQSVYDYLSLGVMLQPATVYNEVQMLPAGHWMRLDVGGDAPKLTQERYWSLPLEPKFAISYQDAGHRIRELIQEAVRLRLRSDVPLGVFLSGGMDSSIIAYEAAQVLGPQLQTFTVGVEDKALDESDVARRTAGTLGVQNQVLSIKVSPVDTLEDLVRHYDQPYSDASAIPSMAVSRLARQHVKVVLNGDGGDEIFAGYRRYVAASLQDRLSWLPNGPMSLLARALERLGPSRRSPLGFALRFLRGFGQRPGSRYLAWTCDMLQEDDKASFWRGPTPLIDTESQIEDLLPRGHTCLDTQLGGDHQINLLSDLLVKMDMATMAASLEGRSPFMDHVLAEFAVKIPGAYHVKGGVPKALLRDAYRGLLPDEVVKAPKRGFEIPLARWLDHELRPMIMDVMGGPDARVRQWVEDRFVDDLLAGKIMQERNRAYIIYALLVLELWLRQQEDLV